ncbi:polygalacturonase PglB [Oryzibacter oryziterrae]|uniref:polygalacturonase PglB n=1 Tax=Oryzibacter oryziterrae TaxID=2766474 RepID=UPI001EFF69A0|nr:glycosyl hydrolase family 28 protein [Oryzibacter oryziterrae]
MSVARNAAAQIAATGSDETDLIQTAIDRLSAAGGGRLQLEAGRHVCAGLRLADGVDLHLAEGAVLAPVPDYAAYAANTVGVIAEDSDRAMIVAKGARNIAISGAGRIEAGGAAFAIADDAAMGTFVPAARRPRVAVFEDCAGVAIADVTVSRSPMWTWHMVACNGVAVRNIVVDNDRRMPNTDGFVVDSCSDVLIEDARIDTADDGIVLKTSKLANGIGAMRDVRVRRVSVSSQSCALKIGTETFGDIEDIVFEDCVIRDSNRALGLFSRDGGRLARVRFSRISVDCHETLDGFWGSGEALTVNIVDRRPDSRPAGAITDLVVEDVTGSMEGAINLIAAAPAGISTIRLSRIDLRQRPGRLGTGRTYDLRPTPADLAPSPDAAGRANAWVRGADGKVVGLTAYPNGMPGVYAKSIKDLTMDDVKISRPHPLPADWNKAIKVIEA